jgi:hypothetical protein
MSLDVKGKKNGSVFFERNYPYLILGVYLILIHLPCVRNGLLSYLEKAMGFFNYRDLISQIMTVESILFGFLLTVLAITIQTNTTAILHIKKAGRFNELISFNKKAIYASFITVFVSLFLYLLPSKNIDTMLLLYWLGLTLLSLLLSFRYVHLFFILIKD